MPANEPHATEATPAKPQAPVRERRAFRRRPFRAKLRFQKDHLGLTAFIDAVPVDISEDGICFVTTNPPTPTTLIWIEIQRPSIGKQLKMQAEAIWIKAVDEKQSRVGCRWTRRLSFTELQQFV